MYEDGECSPKCSPIAGGVQGFLYSWGSWFSGLFWIFNVYQLNPYCHENSKIQVERRIFLKGRSHDLWFFSQTIPLNWFMGKSGILWRYNIFDYENRLHAVLPTAEFIFLFDNCSFLIFLLPWGRQVAVRGGISETCRRQVAVRCGISETWWAWVPAMVKSSIFRRRRN
jgi:hypothetical protein